jgi:hypothetical protein
MKLVPCLLILVLLAAPLAAQAPFEGYTLITPLRSTETFLIDNDINTLQAWHGDNGAGHTVYLLPDFSVIRGQGDPNGAFGGGGSGGHLQRIDADDNVVWDYFFSNEDYQQHHDLEPMPNGNVLLIAWEIKTPDEAVAAGRTAPTAGNLWPTYIVELEPVGSNDANIVWEWRLWDHIIQDTDPAKPNYGIIADHPERVDVNLGSTQRSWDHGNHIDYDPLRDEIVLSTRRMNEVFVIDHSTTTEEAAGHAGGLKGKGGDLLYRWGNPQNYGRGVPEDQVFWGVHGANWIDSGLPGAGGILAFNNGNRPGDQHDASSVVEIQPPRDENGNYIIEPGQPFGPALPDWQYDGGASFYSLRYGSAYRMPNGNTLICEGVDGLIFEVTTDKQRVWSYLEPNGNGVFAAKRYWSVPANVANLDIKPRSCTNPVNLQWLRNNDNGNGTGQEKPKKSVLPVAIAGSANFDVTELNVASLRLEGIAPRRSSYEDVTTPAGGNNCDCTEEGADGVMDLTLKFDRTEIASVLHNVMDGDVVKLTIRGTMLDGAFFEASDCITIRDKDSAPWTFGDPAAAALYPASPNPFNPVTVIQYNVGEPGQVSLNVYDVTGRLVRTLVNETKTPASGGYSVTWDGRNDGGQSVSSGIYFYRLSTGSFSETKKMILLK